MRLVYVIQFIILAGERLSLTLSSISDSRLLSGQDDSGRGTGRPSKPPPGIDQRNLRDKG
jgi:hypothetical protein